MSWEATEYVRTLTTAPVGEPITRDEKILLLILANCHNSHARSAWPSVTALAVECLASVRHVRRLLRRLESKAVLSSLRPEKQGRGALTHYVFCELEERVSGSPPSYKKEDKRRTARARGEGFVFDSGSKSNPEPSPTLPFPTKSQPEPEWTREQWISHVACYYLTRGYVVPAELRELIPAALEYARSHGMKLVPVPKAKARA